MFRRFLPSLILLGACAPQNASIVEGEFTAYLSGSNSPTYLRSLLKPADFAQWTYVDCRTLDEDEKINEELRLGDGPGRDAGKRLPICDDDPGDSKLQPVNVMQETWLRDDGYMVVGDELDPWRGEAVITSEGDVQLMFHQRLPGGQDFRFGFVIDPDFQPRECTAKEDGTVSYDPLDGDWVSEWSKDVEGGRLWYLNAYSFQFDPVNMDDYLKDFPNGNLNLWNLPNEWAAGYGEGMFGDDRIRVRTARYGTPRSYLSYEATANSVAGIPDVTQYDLYYCQTYKGMDGLEACVLEGRMQDFDSCITPVEETFTTCMASADAEYTTCLADVVTGTPECVDGENEKCEETFTEDSDACTGLPVDEQPACITATEDARTTCLAAAPAVCTDRLTTRCENGLASDEGTCNKDHVDSSVRCTHIFDCTDSLFTPYTTAPAPYNAPGSRANQFSAYKSCAVDMAECYRDGTCDWTDADGDRLPDEFASCAEGRYSSCKTNLEEGVNIDADQVKDDLKTSGIYGFSDATELPDYRPMVHTNAWRTPDGAPNGFDDWAEVNYNWVKFDDGSELEKGGAATGEFSLTFDAFDSPSRIFVRGKFSVDHFKKDVWTTAYLPTVKFEENGMTECGMAPE